MAVDPHDLLEPPYGFGECSEREELTTVKCKLIENKTTQVLVTVRKCGDWVEASIPNIVVLCNKGIDKASLKILPFLNDEELGDLPRKRAFWDLVRVYELETNNPIIVPAMIIIKEDGTIKIYPRNRVEKEDGTVVSTNFFRSSGDATVVNRVVTFTINFTYVVNDEHYFNDALTLNEVSQMEDEE